MLKSIIAAAFMITVFTIVTVGTVTMTSEQAFAKKTDKEKVKKKKMKKHGRKEGNRLFEACGAVGGTFRTSSTGANIRCCKRKHCITCPTNRVGYCKERWKALKYIDKRGLSTGSSGTQLAPPSRKKPIWRRGKIWIKKPGTVK